MKEKRYVNYFVVIGLIFFLFVVFVCPFLLRYSKVDGSDFKKLSVDCTALYNMYHSHFPDYQEKDIDKAISKSDLILKVEYNDYYQDYTDYPLVECNVKEVIKGEYSKDKILIHDYVVFSEDMVSPKDLIIRNTIQYLPMLKNTEYYVVLSKNNPKYYEYTNVDFGRINVDGDKPFYDLETHTFYERFDFNYDIIGEFTSFDEQEIEETSGVRYKQYIFLRKYLLEKLNELEAEQ